MKHNPKMVGLIGIARSVWFYYNTIQSYDATKSVLIRQIPDQMEKN